MTIHAAKGREFPVVVVTGLGSRERAPSRGVSVIPNRTDRTLDAKCGDFETPGYRAARDREERHEAAERLRQVYVAATRARDHLALAVYHADEVDCHAARVLASWQDGGQHLAARVEPPTPSGRPADRMGDAIDLAAPTPEAHAEAEAAWLAERERRVAALQAASIICAGDDDTAVAFTPVATEQDGHLQGEEYGEEMENLRGPPISAGSTPDALDPSTVRAVCAALDRVARGSAADDAVAWAIKAFDAEAASTRIHALVRNAIACAEVQRSLLGGRVRAHVSVGMTVGETIVEGCIGLVCEQEEGTLAIVEFETDPGRAAMRRRELAQKALAIQQATKREVILATLVFADAEVATISWEDVASLIAESKIVVSGPTRNPH